MTSPVTVPTKEVATSTGLTLTVYAVPQTLLWSAVPRGVEKPKVPMHTMKTATGPQERLAKEGDPEWEPYLRAFADWEEAQSQVQEDLSLVLALRDVEYPSPINPPEYLRMAVEAGVLPWPEDDDEIGLRATWLRAVLLPSADDIADINYTLMELSGVDEVVVSRMRDSFRSQVQEAFLSAGRTAISSVSEPAVETSERSS